MCPDFVRVRILWKSLFWYFRLLLPVLLLLPRLYVLSAVTSSLKDMRGAPSTITVATEGRDVQYATILDPSRTYSTPIEWVLLSTTLPMPQEKMYTLHSMTPDHFPNYNLLDKDFYTLRFCSHQHVSR